MRSADVRAFIILQPQGLEAINQVLGRTLHLPVFVRIFQSQDELPIGLAIDQPGKECGTNTAYMQEASRTGSKARAGFCHKIEYLITEADLKLAREFYRSAGVLMGVLKSRA